MDTEQLKELQAPLKAKYRETPDAAVITLKADGTLGDGITCSVQTGKALTAAGLHPATGGNGLSACSGDMLLEALVACAGVTLGAVATAIGVNVKKGSVHAEGDLDFRGTLGVAKDAPVGFKTIRLRFDLDTDATEDQIATLLKLTERYCVVAQSLRQPPDLLDLATRLNLGTLLAEAAQRFAAREAFPGMRFGDFLAAARSVRDALSRAGLAANEPVHVRISNQPLDLAAYAGVWLAGGVVVPVHRSSPAGSVAHVVSKTRARFEWDRSLKILSDAPPPGAPHPRRRRAHRLHFGLVRHAEGRGALPSRVHRQARGDPEPARHSGKTRARPTARCSSSTSPSASASGSRCSRSCTAAACSRARNSRRAGS